MNWIKERLNRDNFWNLVFGLGMISGMSIAGFLTEYIYASSAAFWITLLLIPYLIKNCSKVALSADNIMLNCNGESLKGKYPNNLFFLIAFTIGLPVLAGLTMDRHFRDISPIISALSF